jgi:mRNA-degrading endonuclease RelE of RelBE toxin-antitoxin system
MASKWTIEYGPYIQKQFDDYADPIVKTILERIDRLLKNPRSGKPLKGKASEYNLQSLRVTTGLGEFRVIYQVLEEKNTLLVVFIGTREYIYDRLDRWLD